VTASIQDARVRYLKDMRTLLWLACTSREWRIVATQLVCWDPREKRTIVYERVEQLPPLIYAGPSTRRWQVRGSPASFMARGYQCSKAYYIVLANARFKYIAWELSTLRLSNVETWYVLHELESSIFSSSVSPSGH
jgi:hypothetical protein